MSDSLEHLDDSYEVLDKLREGGMGAIYKVRHRYLEQIRVVKVMHARLSVEETFQERFLREAQLATRLRHPNIAEVYDFSIREDTAFLIMEFIDGVNLAQLMKQSGLVDVDLALEISAQSMAALGHMHAQHLVHRDVSPDNLMVSEGLDGRPVVKLIDLGIAKPLKEQTTLTKTGLFMGKLHYASPEQFGSGEEGVELDQRSDLYSFGVVLYQLLTGEVPFSGAESAVMAGHLFHPPKSFDKTDPDDRVSLSLRQIVLKSLEKKASDRFQNAEDFAAALRSQAAGEDMPTQAKPLGDLEAAAAVELAANETTTQRRKHSVSLLAGAQRLAQLEQFDEARAQIETVLALDPGNEEATRLAQRIRDSQIGPLVGEASKLVISHSFKEAEAKLARALDIDPDNETAIGMLDEVKAALERARRQAELERNMEALQSSVSKAIEGGNATEAATLLDAARAELGTRKRFVELEAKVQEATRRAIERQVDELLGDAEKATRDESLADALRMLNEAGALLPGDARIQKQQEAVQSALETHQQRQQLEAIRVRIVEGGLESAARELERVREKLADSDEVKQLARELEGELRTKRASGVASRLSDAEAAVEMADHDLALELIAEARSLAGASADLSSQVEAARVRLEEARQRDQRIAAFKETIDQLLAAGELGAAAEALQEALGAIGEPDLFEQQSSRLAELREQELLEERRRLESARRAVEGLIESGEFSQARLELARALRRASDAAELDDLEQAIEQAEKVAWDAAAAQARARFDGALAKADSALASGSLDEAETLAEKAATLASDDESAGTAVEDLRRRIDVERHRLAAREKAAALVAGQAEALEAEELRESVDELRDTLQRHRDDPEIQQLLQSIEATLEEREEEEKKAEAVSALLEQATAAEESGELEVAKELLVEACELEPDDRAIADRLAAVRQGLEDQQESAARQKEADAQLEAARTLLDEGQLDESRAATNRAIELVGSSEVSAGLLADIEQRSQELEARARAHGKAVELLARAEALVADGQLDEAERLLSETRTTEPGLVGLDALEERLGEAIAERDRKNALEERVGELLEAAGADQEAGRFEEARTALEEAADIGSQTTEIGRRLESLEAVRVAAREEQRRREEIEQLLQSAVSLLDDARLDEALIETDKLLALDQAHKPAAKLRKRIERALQKRDKEIAALQKEEETAARKAEEAAARKAEEAAARKAAAAALEEKEKAAQKAAEAAALQKTVVRQESAPAVEPELKEGARPLESVIETPSAVPAASGSKGNLKWVGLAAAALVVAGVLFFALKPSGDAVDPVSSTDETTAVVSSTDDLQEPPSAEPAPSVEPESPEESESLVEVETPGQAAMLVARGWTRYEAGDSSDALEIASSALTADSDSRGAAELVRQLLDDARESVAQARLQAESADAPALAASSFVAARQVAERGRQLASGGNPVEATRALLQSAALFDDAAEKARGAKQDAEVAQAFSVPSRERVETLPVRESEQGVVEDSEPELSAEEGAGDPEVPVAQPVAAGPSTESALPPSRTETQATPQPPERSQQRAAPSQKTSAATAQPVSSPEDEPDIRRLLNDYEKAYEALDLSAVRRLWPSLQGNSLIAVQRSFENARSIEYKVEQCRIQLSGLTATALCVENQDYRPKKGRKASSTRALNIQLRKEVGGWVIESM